LLYSGEQHVLQQRLKSYFKKVKANLSAGAFDRADVITTYEDQGVDYFCVVDFEATCWEDQDFKSAESEIIEFPAVLLNAKSLVKEAEFHSYCRPAINPVLSEFCTSLTGITQVSGAARVYGFLGDRMSLLKQQLSITGGQINNHCLLCQW
jgi:3'-5' exoribonuclease 1